MTEIALHILDIAENSIQAGADHILISLAKEGDAGFLKISLEDNGKGMNQEEANRCLDPFFTSRTTRKVGLGIPLIRQHAEMCGGKMEVHSERGKGCRVEASFGWKHPDRQPIGDLEACWVILAASNPTIEWELRCSSEEGEFSLTTSEIKSVLEVDDIRGFEMTDSLRRMIRNNMEAIGLA